MDFLNHWSAKTEVPVSTFVQWLGLARSKWYRWKDRYGKANEHNAWIPRDHWLCEWERQAILDFHAQHPLEGYRRLTFMMLDRDVVAVSPSSVYRVLHEAGRMGKRNNKSATKGQGFEQPLGAHDHWHVDIAYLNLHGTFYYLCSVLDGYSRFIMHWEIRESMKEVDVELIVQRAREKHLGVSLRIISDSGPQFVARDFKDLIRVCGMTHVKISPYYLQSNGKIERFHRTIKGDCLRPGVPLTKEDAERLVSGYVRYYNEERLHSAIDYATPRDQWEGRAKEILEGRDRKLEKAREGRKAQRQAEREVSLAEPCQGADATN